jgi:hypothetical protein
MDDPTRRALVRQAQQLVSAGDTGAACRLVESHSRRDDDELLQGWLGVFLVEHGEHARAQGLLHESLQRRPDFVPAALSLIQIPIRERRFDDVVDVYDDVAATIPQVRKRVRTTSQRSQVGRAFAEALRNSSSAPAHDCVVFYHLPFTGGTSAGRMLRYAFASGERYNIRRGSGLRHLARYARLPGDRLQDLRYVHQHHPYPLDPRGRRMTYFTMLREPVARFLSGYFKRRDNPGIVGGGEWREHDRPRVHDAVDHLAEFGPTDAQARQLAILHPTLRDAYRRDYRPSRVSRRISFEDDLHYGHATAHLSADALLDIASDVLETTFLPPLVLEHMEAGYLSLFAQLGIPVMLRPPHLGASRSQSHYVDDATRDRIAALNPVDVELYRRAREQFLKRFGRLADGVSAEKR